MLEKEDISRLKEIFVTREECNENIALNNEKFANDDKRLAVIATYQKIELGVMVAIGTGVLSLVLKQMWG